MFYPIVIFSQNVQEKSDLTIFDPIQFDLTQFDLSQFDLA